MMKDEFHPSYKESSIHACITCKCGKKVWYGCGNKHTHRPMFCHDCTVKEIERIRSVKTSHLGTLTDEQIIEGYLSRKFIGE